MAVPQFLGLLVVILATAKLFGASARKVGQPIVLGELLAGVALGAAGIVDAHLEVLHLLAELGVVILLFEIGLETDLRKLLRVGGASSVVALVGVALPFALGYFSSQLLGLGHVVAVFAGAALTATSVGITARVLSDLNRLQEPESQIILGAAVIDDVIGLVILSVVSGLAAGEPVTALGIAKASGIAFGFLIATLAIGIYAVPPLVRLLSRIDLPGTPTLLALMFALGLAWLANLAGSALIIGAFAAGLLLRETPQAHEMERGIAHLGHFFVPIFFVSVGAAVDLSVLNPLDPSNQFTLLAGGLWTLAAVIGKFAAGYAPWWFSGKKRVIGIGMIPRGEVGLIFAQIGLSAKVFDAGLFSAMTMVVILTTFMAPPLLRLVFPPLPRSGEAVEAEGIEDLVAGD